MAALHSETRSILVNQTEVTRIIREERDGAAHAQRMVKRAGGAALDFARTAHHAAALDLVKAALAMPPIRPSFAFGIGPR
jgi:hypothetical protein